MSASRVSARLASRQVKRESPDTPQRGTPKKNRRETTTPSTTPKQLSKQNEASLSALQIITSESSQDESQEEEEEVPIIQSPVKRRPGAPAKQAKGYKCPTDELSSARSKLSDILTYISRDVADDFDEDADNTDQSLSPPAKIRKIRNTKKSRKAVEEVAKQTFILTLFDRAVDLAPFCMHANSDDVPLYPICREWIRGERTDEELAVLRETDDFDVDAPGNIHRLPNPKPWSSNLKGSPRIPKSSIKPMIHPEDIDDGVGSLEGSDSSTLLADNLKKWRKIKQDWSATSAANEQRYKHSCDVLKSMYEKSVCAQTPLIEPKTEPVDAVSL